MTRHPPTRRKETQARKKKKRETMRRNAPRPVRRRKRRPGQSGAASAAVAHAGKYDLTDEERAWVVRTVDAMGPLTEEQRDALALLLHIQR